MLNSYSISLANEFGAPQTYGFFANPPETNPVHAVYSHVWNTKTLADGHNYEFTVGAEYYAWCGLALNDLVPGGGKMPTTDVAPVTIHTDYDLGNTLVVQNKEGSPTFQSNTQSIMPSGSFEIDTSDDFNSSTNFLLGVAALDESGKTVPVASFKASSNAQVRIKPHDDYWISVFEPAQTTAIDYDTQSRIAAHIDFKNHPGSQNAVVTHSSNGSFTVQYAVSKDQPRFVNQNQKVLSFPVEQMDDHLPETSKKPPHASPMGAGSRATGSNFACEILWPEKSEEDREEIATEMLLAMARAQTDYIGLDGKGDDFSLKVSFSTANDVLLGLVNNDWANAYRALNATLREGTENNRCEIVPVISKLVED